MTSGDERPVEPLNFGRSRAERQWLGLPVQEGPESNRMDSVEPRKRRAKIFCFQHNHLVGVLTDSRLITRAYDVPYPDESNPVLAPCPDCTRDRNLIWIIDVKLVRRAKKSGDAEAAAARQAWEAAGGVGRKPPAAPVIDVLKVAPEWFLKELP